MTLRFWLKLAFCAAMTGQPTFERGCKRTCVGAFTALALLVFFVLRRGPGEGRLARASPFSTLRTLLEGLPRAGGPAGAKNSSAPSRRHRLPACPVKSKKAASHFANFCDVMANCSNFLYFFILSNLSIFLELLAKIDTLLPAFVNISSDCVRRAKMRRRF